MSWRLLVALVAGLATGGAACSSGLFGPPAVTSTEAFEDAGSNGTFDHGPLDELLSRWVDDRGLVDYAGLAGERDALQRYVDCLADAPFEGLSRDEKLALLINAYNAFTLLLILEHWPVASIRDIPASERWEAVRWHVAGRVVSLDQLEHELIRPQFVEPRVHFALVCAALGCPPLRREAYVGSRLEAQLEDQAQGVHGSARGFGFHAEAGIVSISRLYDWYAGDFEQVAGSVLAFAARWSAPLREALERGEEPEVEWLEYDWRLNSQANVGSGTPTALPAP